MDGKRWQESDQIMEIGLQVLKNLCGRRVSSCKSYPMTIDGKRAKGVQQNNGRGGYQVHNQRFLIYYLFNIRAVVMMGCELQDAFWGMRFSFSMVIFLFICYLMETMWQWWLADCVCVVVPFFTELWNGTTYSLNFIYHDFANLVHLTDLMKLHLRLPNSLVCECSRNDCDKSQPVFPYFIFFLKWKRCQSACFTFESALFMLFPPRLPPLCPHFCFFPLFCYIVFSSFPTLTQSWGLGGFFFFFRIYHVV